MATAADLSQACQNECLSPLPILSSSPPLGGTRLAPPTGSLMASPITFCNLRDPSLAPSTVSSYLSSSSLSCAPSGPGLRFMAARQHGLFPLPTHETSCSTSLACSHCIQTTPQYSAASPVNTTDTLNMARGSCQPEQSPADLE